MTGIDDDGVYPLCPACLQRIERYERGVSHGPELFHADCYKDTFGHEAALDASQQKEMFGKTNDEVVERDERRERLKTWANFDKRESGPHGARHVA